jgi:hypothetical protein
MLLLALAGHAMAQQAAAPATTATPPAPPAAPAATGATPAADAPKPWRLTTAFGLPSWLDISGEQRTRYESLDGQFRKGLNGSDQGLFFRTRVKVTAKKDNLEGTLEVLDARQELSDSGSSISTSEVNALEAIQAYGALHFTDVFAGGDKLMVQAGRITMDVGSRRLICRSNFSNAPQTFTGANSVWTDESGSTLQAFAVLPVTRLPSDKQSLLSNNVALDHEDFDIVLAGVHGKWAKAVGSADLEGYIYGLQEDDDDENATKNRELGTTGVRLYSKPLGGKFDYDVEPMLQFGHSRASTGASDTRDLDHLAYAVRLVGGYTFEGTEKFRVALEADYASGDHSPIDGKNQRFDPLYGDRRGDFGPTGIYGPFNRSNLIAVGPRFSFKPTERTDVVVADKFYWLADSSDTWPVANVQDATGGSGSYLGSQPEIILGWDAIPGNLRLEAGAAYLFAGDFMKDAPQSPKEGDASYVYFMTTVTF